MSNAVVTITMTVVKVRSYCYYIDLNNFQFSRLGQPKEHDWFSFFYFLGE